MTMTDRRTIIDLFNESVEKYSRKPFLWEKSTKYKSTSYQETLKKVQLAAAGFLSLGLEKQQRLSLLSEGCSDWIIAELAMLYAGGVNVPLSVKLVEANDLRFRINHSEAKIIVTSLTQLHKIRFIKSDLKSVKKIVVFGAKESDLEWNEISFDALMELGKIYLVSYPDSVNVMSQSIQNDDMANITYTSGTTTDPKGVMLTHRNFTANVEQCLSVMNIPDGFRTLLILPLDHCFAHVTGLYTFMSIGGSLATVPVGKTFIENIRNIPVAINEFQPQVIMTVPALAKTFKNNVEKSIREKGVATEWLFKCAVQINMAYYKEGWNKGTKGSWILKPIVKAFDSMLFSKLRASLGGKLEFFVDGGAYLDTEMQKFWYAVGLPMYQGYGLSEATPVISCNMKEKHKLGTSGQLVSNLELCIRDEAGNALPVGSKGEITVKGENVMKGYWKNPEATAETVKDGWLYTGDLGCIDQDGFLNVFGRSKSLLIGNDGEKYSPEGIEETITTLYPMIQQIMLYNNQHPYTVALVYPNKEQMLRIRPDAIHGKEAREALLYAISNVFADFRKGGKHETLFPERWLPSAFAIISDGFNESNGMLNSTLKLVRGKVEKGHKSTLDFLYSPEGKKVVNELNIREIEKTFSK
jgi:long-chain acyl-CoA synthetase